LAQLYVLEIECASRKADFLMVTLSFSFSLPLPMKCNCYGVFSGFSPPRRDWEGKFRMFPRREICATTCSVFLPSLIIAVLPYTRHGPNGCYPVQGNGVDAHMTFDVLFPTPKEAHCGLLEPPRFRPITGKRLSVDQLLTTTEQLAYHNAYSMTGGRHRTAV